MAVEDMAEQTGPGPHRIAAEEAADETGPGPDRVAQGGLIALYGFTITAVLGYAVFGLNPSRLVGLPAWSQEFYGRSFGFFAIGHVWLATLVLCVVLIERTGLKWLAAFGLVYGLSLASELAGTTWGVPFGEYRYSELLGPMWLDRVPVVIPLSWFFMALPSYALASVAVPGRLARVGAASLILLAWDLALDPAMSHATPYWVWGDAGPYYGMPWLNLVGWYVTGVVLMAVFAALRVETWTSRIGARWWAGYYSANLLLPLGMCAAAGMWGAVLATLGVMSLLGVLLSGTGERAVTS
jgi:putative membrane protein